MGSRTILAAALTVVASVLVLAQAFQWSRSAGFAPVVENAGRCALRIAATNPSSGLREGDTLLLQRMDAPTRTNIVFHFARLHGAPAGSIATLAIERDAKILSVPYRFVRDEGPLTFFAQLGFKLVILAIGLFVLWRGHDRRATWLGVWCTGIAIALPDAWWGAMPDGLRFCAIVLNNFIWTCLPFALYMVVESFVSSVPIQFVWITRVAMAASIAPSFITDVIDASAQTLGGCALVGLNATLVNSTYVGSQLIILLYFIFAYAGTSGLARLRMRWVFWAFCFSRIGVLLNLVNRLFPHPIQLSGIEWLTIVIFPLGCAYAILRHHLIDVNFVLNRTLIYTILTTIVVGIFVLMENVVNSLALGRGAGLAVEVAVALGIGLSFDMLHKRVETLLDQTLFRAKHEAVRQLQQLSEEASYMETPEALLVRATTEIPQALGANGAAVYERRDGVYCLMHNEGLGSLPAQIAVDDAAFVRLRKRLSQIDLSEVRSDLGADAIAFALVVRGELTGAFLCGRRRNGETYAPDEISSVRSAVHEIGVELSAIRARERAELLAGLISGRIDLATARTKGAS